MSDDYSNETRICNLLYKYLESEGYVILQLICPGAQAALSICYDSPKYNVKKTIFPDLIALYRQTIIIGEIKPKFSLADKAKLLDLFNSCNGSSKIKSLIERITKKEVQDFHINYVLVHGQKSSKIDPQITQIVLTEDNVYMH